jgi:VWFA-related protein
MEMILKRFRAAVHPSTQVGTDMNITRRTLLTALPLLPATRLLLAQQDQGVQKPAQPELTGQPKDPQATFSTDVKVVNVLATVRDKKGQIVKNLTKDDFILSEEDRPEVIRYFSRESNLPLTLGLLVDTSGSQRNVLDKEHTASRQFLEQVLRPDRDLAFVIRFDFDIELLQDLTADRVKLERSIDLCEPGNRPQLQQQGGNYPNGGNYPSGGGRGRGGTALYDAIYLAADEVIKKQTGRKALILLTDGVDNGSKYTLSMAIEASQRADTLVYSILFSDPNAYGRTTGPYMGGPMGRRRGMGYPPSYPPGGGYPQGANGKKVLQQIAQETGGRFFEVSHSKPIDKIYAEIEEELRNQYSIGFTSDKPPDAGGLYRKIQLTTKKKDLIVQARDGYYTT